MSVACGAKEAALAPRQQGLWRARPRRAFGLRGPAGQKLAWRAARPRGTPAPWALDPFMDPRSLAHGEIGMWSRGMGDPPRRRIVPCSHGLRPLMREMRRSPPRSTDAAGWCRLRPPRRWIDSAAHQRRPKSSDPRTRRRCACAENDLQDNQGAVKVAGLVQQKRRVRTAARSEAGG